MYISMDVNALKKKKKIAEQKTPMMYASVCMYNCCCYKKI